MTNESYGAASRAPVFSGNRRVPGLYQRRLADGSTVYEVAARLGGKVRRHRLRATTKTDAIHELRALQVDYERGEQHRSPSAAVTVAELLGDFTAEMKARANDPNPKRRRSPRTARHYDEQLGLHALPLLGDLPVGDVRAPDVRRVLDRMAAERLSASTRHGVLTALSSFMRYAVKQGLAERNPVRDRNRDDRPGSARVTEPRYLSADEVRRLLAAMSDTFRPAAAACAYAGLRASEALGLRWRDIAFEAGTLTVSGQLSASGERVPAKTASSEATIPLLPPLAAELRALRQRVALVNVARLVPDALVFTTAQGKPQSRRNLLRAVHAAGDATALNGDGRERVGVHDLRHSFVAVALASGMTLAEAAVLARHANPHVTATVYAGLADDTRAALGTKLAAAFGG